MAGTADFFEVNKNKRPGLDRNIRIYLLTTLLINLGFGVFQTDFNLYILSLGLSADFLGVVLSLTPFAQAIAAIPIGYMAEKIGYKRALLLVNLVVGTAYLLRVISPHPWLIMAASFLAGVMACGYFIIQLPFISHYAGNNREVAYSINSIVYYTSLSLGAMAGGFLPKLIAPLAADESTTFRFILVACSLIILAGTIPLFFLDQDEPDKNRRISLSPYISSIDANTIKFAAIEMFVGLSFAFLMFFMNLIYINHYQASLQSYGLMNACLIIPMIAMLMIGPRLSRRFKNIRVILASRLLSAIFAFITGITTNALLGGSAYILFRSSLSLAQTLWFSFAVSVATRRSRMATSAWLEITFQIGLGIAAILGGKLVGAGAYSYLSFISAGVMLVAFILSLVFFAKADTQAETS